MKVVILAGGKGSRLSNKTVFQPKPMLMVGDKPILWHLMKFFSSYGFGDFVLCLGYKKDNIIKYFSENSMSEFNIQFVDTGEKTSKSKRLMMIKNYINEENFILSYGDDLSDVNINNVIKLHNSKNLIATITTVHPTIQYGIVKINDNGVISDIIEKPIMKNLWINGGFAILNRKIFKYLNLGELEETVYQKLCKERNICAYMHLGFWKSMNTYKDFLELNKMWNSGDRPWKNWIE